VKTATPHSITARSLASIVFDVPLDMVTDAMVETLHATHDLSLFGEKIIAFGQGGDSD